MDGFTITSNKGVQIPVGVKIDGASLTRVANELRVFTETLQKKCNLRLTIDTSAIQESIRAAQDQIASATSRSTSGRSGSGSGKSSEKEFNVSRLNAYNNALARMQLRLSDLGVGKTTKEVEDFRAAIDAVSKNGGKGFDTLAQKAIQAQHSIKALTKETSAAKTITSKYTDDWFAQQGTRLTNLSNGNNSSIIASAQARLGELEQLKSEFTGTASQIETFNAKLREYEQLVARAGSERTLNRSLDDQATSIANLKSQYQAYMTQFGQNLQHNLPLMEKFKKFGEDISVGGPSNELQRRWAELTAEAKRAGVEVQTVRQRMTNLFGQHFNTALIMLAIRGLRQALRQLWQDIKEVNEALVQTQIVTGLSGAALEAYTDKAYAAADKSKDKVTNILSEATAFGRLGYDSELSVQLAQLTSMYSKLGDVDTSDATDAITALMKAFDLKSADEIELALDKMIYVGNNFPISAAGLGEGLNNAASALSSAGNSLEQTLALLMAANATVQNPSKSSTAMRTITARIRNTKAELDELGEELDEKYDTVAKYQKELLGLTGVDILDATGKNFRATYDILKDLADVWGTLTSAQQAAVTTMLAGTRNQDIFASLMKNFPSAEEAMGGIGDAAGLMDERFKAVEDSISGSLSGLSNAWSKFSNALLNSGDIRSFIKMITGLVKALTSLTKVFGGGTLITGVLSLTTLINKFRQFGQIYPQMQATITMLNGNSGLHNVLLNTEQIQTAANALSGYTNAQQRLIMSQAGMSIQAQKQVLEYQGMSTAALGASGATSTLAASVDGLKAKMTAFVQSGNIWIMLIQAIAMVVMAIVNAVRQSNAAAEQAAEEAKRKAEEARQASRDAISATHAAVEAFGNGGADIDNYQSKLNEIADKLEKAALGSDEYKTANLELYDVQGDIIDQFGVEAQTIRNTTADLRDYADALGELQNKREWENMFSGENYHGLSEALKYFGVSPEGTKVNDSGTIEIDLSGVTKTLSFDGTWYPLGNDITIDDTTMNHVVSDWFNSFMPKRSRATYDYSNKRDDWVIDHNFTTPKQTTVTIGGTNIRVPNPTEQYTRISGGITLSKLTFTAENIIDVVEQLEQSMKDLRTSYSDAVAQYGPESAVAQDISDKLGILSEVVKQVKDSTDYQNSIDLFMRWAEGLIKYGSASESLLVPYTDLVNTADTYKQALISGDSAGARMYLGYLMSAMDAFSNAAEDNGYDWATQFAGIITDELGLNLNDDSNLFYRDIANGKVALRADVKNGGTSGEPGDYLDIGELARDIVDNHVSVESILAAGDMTEREARRAGLAYERQLNDRLSKIATTYGITMDEVLQALQLFADLPASNVAASQLPTISGWLNKPKDYSDKYAFANQGTVVAATNQVGALGQQTEKFLQAETLFNSAIGQYITDEADFDLIDPDAAKEAIDAINDYFGTSFEELTQDNIDMIVEMFDSAGDDIYGAIVGNLSDALNYARDNGVDMSEIIDVDSGIVNINALSQALSTLPNSADQAGALASAALADQLMTVAGMQFTLVLDDDGNIKVVATGGELTPPPKKTGGGGGKKSQISDDIENVDRIIKLFRELLNYYDEGSEQWIARQRQIIDKYKAGVEIAMAEYDRLIKKGLKQTDDDVKKIVDTILEYQGDIFEESKRLWEAVRQNQIDAIKHTKDQNDAAIELEKTHHDLLISIRNERRELEDELKAARDAYSEVMTPEELDALFSAEDFATLMDKLAGIEGDAMELYRDYREQIAAVSEDETYMIEHITDEFKRQYDIKMKEYEIAKAELGVARAQQELENVKNEQTVMMLIDGRWQWVADPEKVLEAEQKLADAEQELADAQDEYNFQSLIHTMEAQSSEYQRQIDALEALTFSMDELAEQIHLFSDSVYKELLSYLSQIAQSIFDKYDGDTAIPAFAEGGVIKRSGLATVHSGEPIFSTADAEKLWRFVHDLGDAPVNTSGVYSGITSKLASGNYESFGGTSQVSIDNSINIPGGIHVHGETAQQLITLLKDVVAPYNPNA